MEGDAQPLAEQIKIQATTSEPCEATTSERRHTWASLHDPPPLASSGPVASIIQVDESHPPAGMGNLRSIRSNDSIFTDKEEARRGEVCNRAATSSSIGSMTLTVPQPGDAVGSSSPSGARSNSRSSSGCAVDLVPDSPSAARFIAATAASRSVSRAHSAPNSGCSANGQQLQLSDQTMEPFAQIISDLVCKRLVAEISDTLAVHHGSLTEVFRASRLGAVKPSDSRSYMKANGPRSLPGSVGPSRLPSYCSSYGGLRESQSNAISDYAEAMRSRSFNDPSTVQDNVAQSKSSRVATSSSTPSVLPSDENPKRASRRALTDSPYCIQEVMKELQQQNDPCPSVHHGSTYSQKSTDRTPHQKDTKKAGMAVKDLESKVADALIAEACLPNDARRLSVRSRNTVHSRTSTSSQALWAANTGQSSALSAHAHSANTLGGSQIFWADSNSREQAMSKVLSKRSSGRRSNGKHANEGANYTLGVLPAQKAKPSNPARSWIQKLRAVVTGKMLPECAMENLFSGESRDSSPRSKAKAGTCSKSSSIFRISDVTSSSQETGDAKSDGFTHLRSSMASTMTHIRTSRVNDILMSNEEDEKIPRGLSPGMSEESLQQEELWSRIADYYLKVCGIFPWIAGRRLSVCDLSTWYQWIFLLLSACALAGCMEQIVSTRGQDMLCYSRACLRLGLLSDASLALGSLCGLISLGIHLRSRFLVECQMILLTYATNNFFLQRWSRAVNLDFFITLVLLVLATIERLRTCRVVHSIMDGSLDVWGILQTVAFIFYSSVLLGETLAVLQFCRNLMIMIDVFCFNLVNKSDLKGAVHEWNKLQAILRRASDAVQCCFFVLQTTALCFVFSGVTDMVLLLRQDDSNGAGGSFGTLVQTLIPGLLVTGGVARIFFCAAAVTDKCFHVPSLVNSLSYGEEIDPDRQYVVDYIIHSAAGFYVFEVRLTSALALKFMYFCGAAAFTVATTAMAGT